MVKHILFYGIAVLLLMACQNHNVEIKGHIKDAEKQKVYLDQLNVDQIITVDSVKTDRQGHFSFKTTVTLPTFYTVRIGQKEAVTVLAEPDKQIQITGTLDKLSKNYWVDGSEGSLWIKLLNFQLSNTQATLDSLKKVYTAIPTGKEHDLQRTSVVSEWDSVITKQVHFSRDFIIQHAISPAAYYALYQKIDKDNFILTPETDLQSYKIVASSMTAMYPESQYTKALMGHYEQIKKNIQALRMKQWIANSENNLPEISLLDINGNPQSLNSLKGKYIILDFTILGTPESIAYINELKEIYNKYHHKGVEIYQVCLDQNKLLWEECIRKFGINWKCVLDPESTHSTAAHNWNVQNIPANYIISKEFDIVGKNLYGQRLKDRLQDIIK